MLYFSAQVLDIAVALRVGLRPVFFAVVLRIGNQAGQKARRPLPTDDWFKARLQRHSLEHHLAYKRQRPVFSELNERMCALVKISPDVEFLGPLTNWDKECKFLWEYFQYPADAFSVRICACYKFSPAVRVATAHQRMRKFVSIPDIAVQFQATRVTCVASNREVGWGELQRVLGVDDKCWQEFLQAPLCLGLACLCLW